MTDKNLNTIKLTMGVKATGITRDGSQSYYNSATYL